MRSSYFVQDLPPGGEAEWMAGITGTTHVRYARRQPTLFRRVRIAKRNLAIVFALTSNSNPSLRSSCFTHSIHLFASSPDFWVALLIEDIVQDVQVTRHIAMKDSSHRVQRV